MMRCKDAFVMDFCQNVKLIGYNMLRNVRLKLPQLSNDKFS